MHKSSAQAAPQITEGMATLSLKISIVEQGVTKTMQFEPATTVYDACRIIREKITEANLGQPKDYGLFLADEDAKIGVWLEPGRSLNYYILKGGELLEYKRKLRQLRVRMLDGTLKTMLVDDSQPVANLMVVICTKIGITNHDEYSLVRELPEDELENKPGNYGTLTLKRRKEEGRERDAKMEQLRKKLKTDDEVNWIDPSKTLREQGIDESETVLLRRKFFFSDQNIDSRDPVQLNLLYVQARDAILDGTHPVTLEKACEFAGIQCQIQFGDFVETKHKPGFLDLKEFLPQSYIKIKSVEKKIFAEHRKHIGISELDAKVLYTKTARDLKTYGVTFFLVKEKMKGKNKLVPRLLGVTKDSVLRLDERTKEILKTWPLTTVRRWGASPNTFTLDFGDYSDQYYSVQTTEAEQILQLISGYIDIILKKKQAKDHFGIEGDEGSTMVEDSVSPNKATILQHETSKVGKANTASLAKPAIMRAGADGARPYGTGHMGGAQFTTVTGQANISHSAAPMVMQTKVTTVMSEPQRALVGTINAGHDAISAAEHELQTKAQLPKLGNDPASIKWKETTLDTNKQSVSSQIAAMNAATAQVVTLTSGPSEDVDHNAVGAAISTITSNLPEMTRGVRMIAALIDDDDGGDKLLDAARRLCSAFSDMLKAAEPEAKEPRQSLLNAAGKVGEASHAVLASIGEEDDSSRELQEMLLGLAKAVANTTAALVLKAKNIAAACDDQNTQNQVIGAATQCALATSQLVACAKVVAPTLQNAACQEQLVGAVREVARAVEHLVSVCQEAQPEQKLMGDLNGAVAEVTRSLNDLLHHIKFTVNERGRENMHEDAVETIMVTTDRMMSVSGDSAEMVRQARILGRATAQLIQAIKGEADVQQDTEVQRRLLLAAKTLADATARMVEAARLCASSPHEATHQDALRHAAEEIRAATTNASTPAMRARIIQRLENSAKQVASCATQTLSAAQGSLSYNTNQVTHQHLLAECRQLADQVPKLVESIKNTSARPEDPEAQLTLIETSETILQPGSRVIQSARSAVPTVSDQASSTALSQSSQQLASALGDLRSATARAREACGPELELESAERLVAGMRQELAAFERQVQLSQLRPIPGDTADASALQLGSSAQNVVASMAKLASAAAQGNENYTGREARATAAALSDFTNSVRAVAATTNDKPMQTKIILNAEEVMERSLLFLDEARRAVVEGNDKYDVRTLGQCCKRVQQSIDETINCLPSQKDVDDAINIINEASQILAMNEYPPTNKSYGQLTQDLHNAAAYLNDASTDVAGSVGSAGELSNASKKYGDAFTNLLTVGMEMAGQTTEPETRNLMIMSLKSITVTSSSLLITSKSVAADPSAPNAKNKLSGAARAVTDSINQLVDVCTQSAPGQKECDNALRNIQAMKPLLDNPSEPVSEATYFECLDSVMEKSKSLGDGMTGIANHAKKGEHQEFASSVRNTSAAICGLVEAAAQSAFLVAVSDPSSSAGRPGLIDQAMCSRASHAIHTACQSLSNQASSQQQVLSAATIIAKHTSALCNACRIASAQTHNPVAKRHFVQSAKDVANSTANLVKEIKALDRDYSQQNRERCAAATQPLLDAVDSLYNFASSSEFASVPGRISEEARRSQQPITQAGRSIIDGSCAMIGAAKSLAVNPRDPPTWQILANHSKSVSDSIKRLVSSIRDKAPGQKECDYAIELINNKIRDLDQASLDAVSQCLRPRKELNAQKYREQTEASASEILDRLEPLRSAAKFEAEKIGHSVTQVANYLDPLVNGAIGAASNMTHSKQQMVLLDQTKSVAESILQFVFAAKEGGGNPKALKIHPDIDEACDASKEALQDLGSSLEKLATQAGIVTGIVESISRSMARITDRRVTHMETNISFVDYQTRMVTCAKELARISQEMVGKAGSSDTSRLAPLGGELSRQYAQLASDAGGASSATTNPDVAQRLTSGVQDLGQSCIDLVRSGGNCQPGDSFAQREVAEAGRSVSEKVSQVLAALQAGSRGTQACINAASTVSGIIGDLDTTIMFATAGTLHAEGEGEVFADHREQILKTAKALVEDTKTLVAGAASSQEQLAVAAQNAVTTIVQLAEVVKHGAASLGSNNPEAQVMLINAVKDVASALGDLIQATKAASGKSITDPSMNHLKESAKVVDTQSDCEPADWFVSDQEEELIRLLGADQGETASLGPTGDIQQLLAN
ncbi:talin-2 isoform X2 [Cloeon dipterum]|uniref:talin-2 isoform X2 n=1 Tax=Cloeon dipterum TaxID=197152 RepID=UPI0032203E42